MHQALVEINKPFVMPWILTWNPKQGIYCFEWKNGSSGACLLSTIACLTTVILTCAYSWPLPQHRCTTVAEGVWSLKCVLYAVPYFSDLSSIFSPQEALDIAFILMEYIDSYTHHERCNWNFEEIIALHACHAVVGVVSAVRYNMQCLHE